MKRISFILSVFVPFLSFLLISCGDDASTPRYDLRTLSQVYETIVPAIEDKPDATRHGPLRGHGSMAFDKEIIRQAPNVRLQASANQTSTTCAYQYGENAHLYWTTATCKDHLGATISTGNQTLDEDGFPTRRISGRR